MTEGFDDPGAEAPDVGADVAEGQATDQSSSPLWDSYLSENEIPEPAHNYVRDALKYHDGLTTKKFQEASEYRKQWEPYEKIDGFKDWSPEDLAEALPVLSALMDEDQQEDAVRRMAVHLGLISDEDEVDDPDGLVDEEPEGGPPSWFQEQFAPVQQFVQTMQEREQQQAAQTYIDESFGTIEKEIGRKLNDDEMADVKDRAEGNARRGDPDPVASAWAAHKSFRTRVEKEFIGNKSGEPGRAETGHSAPPGSRVSNGRLSLEDQAKQMLRDQIAGLGANPT